VPKPLLNLIEKLQRNYPFFSEMENIEVGQFLKLCKRETFETGKMVFNEGKNGNEFYLVVSGAIIITVGDKEVARMTPRVVFGEMALLGNSRRTASTTAADNSLLFSISREVLHSKMPTFANKVMEGIAQQLAEKLREANETIKSLQRQVANKK
jgi:CRP-like cAMP-binding protein